MQSQGRELAAIDFESIIGGPLLAAINAQAVSANATIDFIKKNAFVQKNSSESDEADQLKFIPFDFSQMMGSGSSGTGKAAASDSLTIKVPLLTMLPIPFLRIDSMSINFNVSLHSTHKIDEQNTATVKSSTSGSENLEIEKTQWTASVSDQNTYQNSQSTDDTYSLAVTVHAVQDQMPGGMKNVLDIFSNVIQTQSALVQQAMSEQVAAQSKKMQDDLPKLLPNDGGKEKD